MGNPATGAAAHRALHPELDEVALLSLDDVCATASISRSYFLAEVAAGRGPTPLRFGVRCTRYRMTDVRDWLAARIEAAASDVATTEAVMQRATKAARESLSKRGIAAKRAA
jgi:predicted DNA-binding transcriptional regulator AlpA